MGKNVTGCVPKYCFLFVCFFCWGGGSLPIQFPFKDGSFESNSIDLTKKWFPIFSLNYVRSKSNRRLPYIYIYIYILLYVLYIYIVKTSYVCIHLFIDIGNTFCFSRSCSNMIWQIWQIWQTKIWQICLARVAYPPKHKFIGSRFLQNGFAAGNIV